HMVARGHRSASAPPRVRTSSPRRRATPWRTRNGRGSARIDRASLRWDARDVHPKRRSSTRTRVAKDRRAPLVLVVDDFVDNREMYTEYLVFAGYRVVSADNGQTAIATALAEMPDVINMDLSLPVMDGW